MASLRETSVTGSLFVSSSVHPALTVSGSGIFTGAVTASLHGTASFAVSASWAPGGGNNLAVAANGSTNTVSQLVFSNSNGITFGLNGSTITATAAGGGGGNLNVSAGTTSNNMTQVVFSNANNISFGLDGSTVTAAAGPQEVLSYFNPSDAFVQVAGQIGQGSLHMQPAQFPDVQFDRIMLPFAYSNASNSSNSFTVSLWWGLYTRNGSTLSSISSVSTSYNITNSGTVGSYSLYGGMRLVSAGFTGTITEGQYYVAMLSRTTTGGGAGMSMSNMLASQINSSFSGIFGAASNNTIQYTRGLGMYSATTSAIPASIAFSQLTGISSAFLRKPLFYVVSQTF